ncbi:hypothetical protein N8D56_21350 [Devosia sp. A8/3-2]|nr:hypothetical protein N8D56_21350 [Devosia sp. A8/3-2]
MSLALAVINERRVVELELGMVYDFAAKTYSSEQEIHDSHVSARYRLMHGPAPKPAPKPRSYSYAPALLPAWPTWDVSTVVPMDHETRPWMRVVKLVVEKHGVTPADILGPSHKREFVAARQEAMCRAYTDLGMSTLAIGRRFRRDHTTVLHSIRIHRERVGANTAKRDVIAVSTAPGDIADVVDRVIAEAASEHRLSRAQIIGDQKGRSILIARWTVFRRLYQQHGLNYHQIGRAVGDRDHTSIMSGLAALAKHEAQKALEGSGL